MSEMESLWPKFDDCEVEDNNSIQILRAQASALRNETKNAVNATFSKMTYKAGPTSAIKSLGQMMSSMSSPVYEEVLDEELEEKTDVNTLFKHTKYKFEIFNNEYRFRLFVLNYSELYPISLEVDGGILEDILYSNNSPISSDDELKSVIKDIFSSKKVHTVVAKMLQENHKKDSSNKNSP